MLKTLIIIYSQMLPFWFCIWLSFFLKYPPKPEERKLSIIILIAASILWPITVPFAYLELLSKKQN